MRKFAAIFFFLLFLFNLVGYRYWFNYAQQQSDKQLESSLDNHQYNDADLIAITVPLSMPYQTVQSDFERVDGEMNVNGKIYKYVKRKIVDGQMILMCLPDQSKMNLQSAKNDFFKSTNDIAQNNTSKKSDNSKSSVFKNLGSDYEQQIASYTIAQINTLQQGNNTSQSDSLLSSPHTPQPQPPDVI